VTDLLQLPHLRTLNLTDQGDHYQVQAEGRVEPTACPDCQHPGLYRHGTQRQTYIDTPMHGKRVRLEIDRKRFRCKACGKTLFEPLPDMDPKRQATSRLIRYIEERCLKQTFVTLAREIGVDDKTIRFVFDDHVARLEQAVKFETPEILGIDEVKIIGDYRATITNIEKLSLFDLRPTRKKVDLLEYFHSIPDKQNVQVVVMDMWNVYRQVARAQFPKRLVVADKFHVVRMANDALERIRKKIRKDLAKDRKLRLKLKDERFVMLRRHHTLDEAELAKLEEWKKLFPRLGVAHELKEQFFRIYDEPTRAGAEHAARRWEAAIPADMEKDFRALRTALNNWWSEIFNYWEYQVTNAYTESVNNLLKSVNRMGRGYSFEVVRARLLFDEKAREKTRTTLRTKKRKPKPSLPSGSMARITSVDHLFGGTEEVVEERVVEYGPHIPTLVKLLDEGYFD
jgi:transposase